MVVAACLLATAGTALAQDAPRVTGIRTVADTGAPLGKGAQVDVAVSQLRVTFSLPMLDLPGNLTPGDVDAPDSYRLLAAGPDGVTTTTDCAAPAGDDVPLALLGAAYSATTRSVALTVATSALPRAGYVLLACDTLSEIGGLLLDGDGDGVPGGDHVQRFDVRREHRLLNSSFNTGIDGWAISNLGPPSTWNATFDPRDAAGAESSGALRIDAEPGDRIRLYQCINAYALGWTGQLWPAAVLNQRVLSGSAAIVVDLWVSFGPEFEEGCWGPGLLTPALSTVVAAQSQFSTVLGPEQAILQLPLVNVTVDVVPLEAGTSVLLDDIQLGFGDWRFAAGFESAD